MSEKDFFSEKYEVSLDEIVNRNLDEFNEGLDEAFDRADTQFDVLQARHESWEYTAARKVDHFAEDQTLKEGVFDRGYLDLCATIKWKGDNLLLTMMSPVDLTQMEDQFNLSDRVGLAASLGDGLGRMAATEAQEHGIDLELESSKNRVHPFTYDDELTSEEMTHPFENEDPYRAVLIPFSHTDISPITAMQEDGPGEFRDWALNIEEKHILTFFGMYARILASNEAGKTPLNHFDALRVNLICAATFADNPALVTRQLESGGGEVSDHAKDPGRHMMYALAHAVEHLGMLKEPRERVFGALMLQKAFAYCHFEQFQTSFALFGGCVDGIDPQTLLDQVADNDGSSFYVK